MIPSPLFRDPIFDGATDPVIIWNNEESSWWILYTQRRSTEVRIGFSSIHGSKIGIASSVDGKKWLYRGTLPDLDFENGHNTFWAPEVIFANGKYHMYVSYITGIPTDWNYPRHIVHYSADNLWKWKFESVLNLSSEKVIDACVYEIKPGRYKMWYKDEANNSHTYTSESNDLYNWENMGPAISDCSHEGANVFEFKGSKWMITDFWKGLAVYSSEDFYNWKRQEENILDIPGKREWDNALGHHADVLVHGDRAFIFYFVHPVFEQEPRNPATCLLAAELKIEDGKLVCDRDADLDDSCLIY